MILTDRSRIVARQECETLRYLNYHWGGTGLQKKVRSLPLVDGIFIHEAQSKILSGIPYSRAYEECFPQYEKEVREMGVMGAEDLDFLLKEQGFLLYGLLRGWSETRLPLILQDYVVVSVEEQMRWEMDPGVLGANLRFDAILRRKDDGVLFILDYKTLGFAGESFFLRHQLDDQWFMYLNALQEITGERVGGVMIEGMVKGQWRTDTAKGSPFYRKRIQSSPFCYGYKLDGPIPMFQTDYTSKKGWRKVAGWDEMSKEEWYGGVFKPNNPVGDFFPTTIISPPPAHRARWKRGAVYGELRFHERLERVERIEDPVAKQAMVETLFPMTHGRCYKYGADNPCAFLDLCFSEQVAEDPLGSDLYERRVPHHDEEV